MTDIQPTVSLQKKLVKTSVISSIVAGLIAFVLLMALTVYQTMDVHDEIMDEISDMLLVSDLSASSGNQLDELSDEFDIEYQLSTPSHLLTHSPEFNPAYERITPSYVSSKGYGYAWLNGTLMRTYSFDQDQQHVSMYQPMTERFKDALQSLLGYALILLILWLIQWFILKYSVRKQFISIHELSNEISAKNAHDLTPIQQKSPALEELQPMVLQLNQMLLRLDHSLQAEQRFTADASHELRSPLSAIQMRLQLLKRKYADTAPTLAQDMNQISTDVARGTQVLENLLLLARLDPSQTTELPHEQFDLTDTIQAVIKSLHPFALEKQVTFDLQLENSVIDANKDLIFTCVRNLIDNAIRYTPNNGQIKIQLANNADGSTQVIIENSGQTLPEEVLNRLGERFYRQLGTKTTGSGLGLSICKKIIDLHQAGIAFTHSELGGLKVTIHFSR
ncbi:sensor histidine kinase [Acinetobacter shaoyimingii]|uniref:sensor histidine kinase n=1 Tax=Acinetobacter shaoyimingii TaxID=2715164 RepID=UPI0014900D99|nr:HAMP domain-containing sensor histidine kinase [Acinetobacter shaoyimingii]